MGNRSTEITVTNRSAFTTSHRLYAGDGKASKRLGSGSKVSPFCFDPQVTDYKLDSDRLSANAPLAASTQRL